MLMNAHQTHALMETVSTHLVPITASATQVSRGLLPSKLVLVRRFALCLLMLQMFWPLLSDPIGVQRIITSAISVNPNRCYINWNPSSGPLSHLLCCSIILEYLLLGQPILTGNLTKDHEIDYYYDRCVFVYGCRWMCRQFYRVIYNVIVEHSWQHLL